ncbi:CAP domain-containing protein [Fusarium redolens]|uniref:CAP domain-containing protein n=1 Tax=Fusarium redolens TaxID=48865 RepID=A0A9P9JZR8_FUSRE|nr:CAP domain-containing protein [Fusarium redolens]KAH7234869.1 CAP domain-containing protein [Fusarium redolens]
MHLSTLYIHSSLLLASSLFSTVIAAPSNNLLDADISVDGFGLPDESGDNDGVSAKAKVSAENDYKVPNGYNKPRVLEANIDVTRLGVDPIIYYPDNDDEDTDVDDTDEEKRSIFARLFTRALTSDKKEALRRHNVARSKVKVKAIQWDSKLESAATAYAKKLAKAGKMQHSAGKDRPNQGENLAYAWASNGFKNPITAGTQGWLNEKKHYKGETIPKGNFSDYGHYTQCVWKSSTKIGIGAAKDSKGAWYTVARYSGPGNVVGQKPY